jgi:hypothetical protein
MKQTWRTYEEVATYLLNQFANEFGLTQVEGEQEIAGLRLGTNWKIDAKGVREGNEGFVIVECRRYMTSKQSQGKLASLSYQIHDTGAQGGIIVSPLGIQQGAAKIAASENILNVRIDANSTPTEFVMQFLNKLMVGVSGQFGFSGNVTAKVSRTCPKCGETFTVKENERFCPSCRED